jgi:hypothetical protein
MPTEIEIKKQNVKNGQVMKVEMANNGGFVAVIRVK